MLFKIVPSSCSAFTISNLYNSFSSPKRTILSVSNIPGAISTRTRPTCSIDLARLSIKANVPVSPSCFLSLIATPVRSLPCIPNDAFCNPIVSLISWSAILIFSTIAVEACGGGTLIGQLGASGSGFTSKYGKFFLCASFHCSSCPAICLEVAKYGVLGASATISVSHVVQKLYILCGSLANLIKPLTRRFPPTLISFPHIGITGIYFLPTQSFSSNILLPDKRYHLIL